MSVINTMLQDLDKRRGRSAGAPTPAGPDVVGVDAVRPTRGKSQLQVRPKTLLVLGALAAAAVLAIEWLAPRPQAATILPPPVPAPAPAKPADRPAAVPMAATPSTALAAAPASASVPSTPAAAMPPSGAMALAAAPAAVAAAVKPTAAAITSPASKQASPATPTRPARAAETATPPSDTAPSPAGAASPRAAVAPRAPAVAKTYDARQQAAMLLNEAIAHEQAGRAEDARTTLRRVLALQPQDSAPRLMLARLEADAGRLDDARALLAEGQRLHPEQTAYTMALARLRADAGDLPGALALLEKGKAAAQQDPQYHAALAGLQLRALRPEDAVQNYLVALRHDPAQPAWLVGIGVALEATDRTADAADAYRRVTTLSQAPEGLARFAAERLARMRPAGVAAKSPTTAAR